MSVDDELRRAFERAGGPGPDPGPVRERLRPAMRRARTRRRLARASASASVGVLLVGGSVAAFSAIGDGPDAEIGPQGTASLPPPVSTSVEDPTPTPPPSSAPEATSEASSTSTTAPPTSTTGPATTSTTSLPPTSSVPPPSTTEPGPIAPLTHETSCGSVTFSSDGTTITVENHTTVGSYTFTTQQEHPDELQVKWLVSGEDECEVEVHLIAGRLVVDTDAEP